VSNNFITYYKNSFNNLPDTIGMKQYILYYKKNIPIDKCYSKNNIGEINNKIVNEFDIVVKEFSDKYNKSCIILTDNLPINFVDLM
jgi:hypothetical protein